MTEKSKKSWLSKATNYFSNRLTETEEEKKQRIFKETKWQMLHIDLQLLESNLLKQYSELGKKFYKENRTKRKAKNKTFLKMIENSYAAIDAKKKEMKVLETTIFAQAKTEKNKLEKREMPKKEKTASPTKKSKKIPLKKNKNYLKLRKVST